MRRRVERGLSLVELLVTVAVTGTTLLAVTELFELSYDAIASAGRGALAPSVWQSSHRLRSDGQAADAIVSATSPYGPLRFDYPDGRSVVWRVHRGGLRRTELDATGRRTAETTILRRVVGWWWRPLGPDLLEVRLTVEHPPPASGIRTRRERPPWVRTTEVLHIARRGRDGGRSW